MNFRTVWIIKDLITGHYISNHDYYGMLTDDLDYVKIFTNLHSVNIFMTNSKIDKRYEFEVIEYTLTPTYKKVNF